MSNATPKKDELKKPNMLSGQPMVTIVVSNEAADAKDVKKETFSIHKNYLCHYSPFFHAAFNGKFKEGETQTMILSDVDPKIFGLLNQWIYHQTIAVEMYQAVAPAKTDGVLARGIDALKLGNLWILAERFLMPSVQNFVMKTLFTAMHNDSNQEPPTVIHHFDKLMKVSGDNDPTSPLSSCIIKQIIWTNSRVFETHVAAVPPSLVPAVMKGLRAARVSGTWTAGVGPVDRWLVEDLMENKGKK